MTGRPRVLVVGEAVTLAHVSRSAALARLLDRDRFDVHTAWDPRYDHLVGPADSALWTISPRRFAAALYRGTPIYREADLIRYVRDDLDTIERVRPDVVVGDFRLSLDVSARLAGVRYVAVANAYWSRQATVHAPVPDSALTAVAGVRLGQRILDATTPAVAAWHAHAFTRLRRRHGRAPGIRDIRDVYTQGDTTLYADIRELVPMAALPNGHHFLGPVPWSPDIEPPDWWNTLPTDRPLVYLSLGSSGRRDLLPVIVDALARMPVTVVVATMGAPIPQPVPGNVHLAAVLPGDRVTARSDVVIGNGGSPHTYQALTAGKPVIGVCGNLDQYLNMTLVAQSGAGIVLRSGQTHPALIQAAVQRALDDAAMRRRAGELAQVIAGYSTARRFRETIEDAYARRIG